jgi:hypothetical protein
MAPAKIVFQCVMSLFALAASAAMPRYYLVAWLVQVLPATPKTLYISPSIVVRRNI